MLSFMLPFQVVFFIKLTLELAIIYDSSAPVSGGVEK